MRGIDSALNVFEPAMPRAYGQVRCHCRACNGNAGSRRQDQRNSCVVHVISPRDQLRTVAISTFIAFGRQPVNSCRRLIACLLFPAVASMACAASPPTPVDWVNTYIGTGGSSHGPEYGGTMPLVTTPFGMTNWTPQTRQNRISVSSYAYEDNTITGFIGTHQPAIWMGDYGYVTVIPEMGELNPTVE